MMDTLRLCPEDGPFDFRSRCIRETWAILAPIAVTALICIKRIRLPARASESFAPLREFLTVEEAEALKGNVDISESARHFVPLWKTIVLASLGILETLAWLALGSYCLITAFTQPAPGILFILGSLPWLYATARPIFFPKASVSYDLLYLYLTQFASSALVLGGILYDHAFGFPLPGRLVLVGLSLHIVVVVVLIIMMLVTPVGLPPANVNAGEIVSNFVILVHNGRKSISTSPGKYCIPRRLHISIQMDNLYMGVSASKKCMKVHYITLVRSTDYFVGKVKNS
jgi:hypothetical protein